MKPRQPSVPTFISQSRLRWLAAGPIVAVVWLFVYNSGLGYDALEILVIGRSIAEGVPFYTFAPSKSFGLYYLTAGFLSVPGAATHAGISIIVTALLLLTSATTFLAMRRLVGDRGAVLAGGLIGAAGIFMELNYLLPEGLVFMCGLAAVSAVMARDDRRRLSRWFQAGAWIGAGMAFKVVAALYGLAIGLWIPLAAWLAGERVWATSTQRLAAMIGGLFVALAIPAAFFWATGRLDAHLEWTYVFPMRDYPSRTDWLPKLYTKLLWVWMLIAAGLAVSLHPRIRTAVYEDERTWLLAMTGLLALLPLIKSQASHFAFPGLAFLLLYAVAVFAAWQAHHPIRIMRALKPLAIGGLAACVISAVIYQPAALERLTTLRSYADEARMRSSIARLIPHDGRAIFFGQGLALYWLSGRHPNWPILHTDVQATYVLLRRPAEMLAALDDPRLALVEFNPSETAFADRAFFDRPEGRAFLQQMLARLQAGFRRDDVVLAPLVIWTRDSTERARHADAGSP